MFSGLTFPLEQWLRMVALVFAGLAITTHLTSGDATLKAYPCSIKMFLLICRRSFLYMPFFLGNPPRKTITSASLNMSLGLEPLVTDFRYGKTASLSSIITPFSTASHCGISSSLSSMVLFPNTWPVSNKGKKEQAICPAAPVTQTLIEFSIQQQHKGSDNRLMQWQYHPRRSIVSSCCLLLLVLSSYFRVYSLLGYSLAVQSTYSKSQFLISNLSMSFSISCNLSQASASGGSAISALPIYSSSSNSKASGLTSPSTTLSMNLSNFPNTFSEQLLTVSSTRSTYVQRYFSIKSFRWSSLLCSFFQDVLDEGYSDGFLAGLFSVLAEVAFSFSWPDFDDQYSFNFCLTSMASSFSFKSLLLSVSKISMCRALFLIVSISFYIYICFLESLANSFSL